jgi:hypothetical protein
MAFAPGYGSSAGLGKPAEKVVIRLSRDEIQAVDAWGPGAGMRSRNDAFRNLLKKGLQFVEAEAGSPGEAAAGNPDRF